jgi:glucose/arabinose dehydrogenase
MKIVIFIFSFCILSQSQSFSSELASGTSNGMKYRLEKLHKIGGVLWGMDFLNPNLIILTKRSGKIVTYNLRNKKITTIKGVPEVWAKGQGGLLDIAKSPTFDKDRMIFLTYSKIMKNGKSATTLASAKLQNSQLHNWSDLLVTKPSSSKTQHFGSRIAFDDDGKIYFGIGDRGDRSNGQSLKTHAGSILRLNINGTVPLDNPYIKNKEVLPEIWSYGHRNPQGLVFDKSRKVLFEIEHGPRGGDEINIIHSGKNYGWPRVSHGSEYWGPISVGEATSMKGMQDPIKIYTPSIAPCGLIVYSGKVFKKWKGSLFTGALAKQHINRIELKNNKAFSEEKLFENLKYRFRNLKEGPDGFIYATTDSGLLLRIRN